MARILLGWEIGGNLGHAVTLRVLARLLRNRGHEVVYVVQRLDAISVAHAEGCEIWQAPVSPRLIGGRNWNWPAPVATHGDILARLGFDDSDIVATIIANWQALFLAIRPDVVVGQYAPFLLLSARGKIPTVAAGNGFVLPPADLAEFPSLTGREPVHDETTLLDGVNRALVLCGQASIDRLPAVYEATRTCVNCFIELDPYAVYRKSPSAPPAISGPVPQASEGEGTEVFIYGTGQINLKSDFWSGLQQSGLPLRAYISGASQSYRKALSDIGVRVEDKPLPFSQIARRSRLLVSQGGLGFVSSGLLTGLPQVICYADLEKALIASAITDLHVGGQVALDEIRSAPFSASLRDVYNNEGLARRATAAAPEFHRRMSGEPLISLAGHVQELCPSLRG